MLQKLQQAMAKYSKERLMRARLNDIELKQRLELQYKVRQIVLEVLEKEFDESGDVDVLAA